jgi:hypothetical protein
LTVSHGMSWTGDASPYVTKVTMTIEFAGGREPSVFATDRPYAVEIKVDEQARPPVLDQFLPADPEVLTPLTSMLWPMTGVTLRMKASKGHRITYDPAPPAPRENDCYLDIDWGEQPFAFGPDAWPAPPIRLEPYPSDVRGQAALAGIPKVSVPASLLTRWQDAFAEFAACQEAFQVLAREHGILQ